MKVNLLTLQGIKNYGSVLQTYATQTLLKNYFDDVITYQFIRKDTIDSEMMKEWTKHDNGIKKILKLLLLRRLCKRYQFVFNSFLAKYINLTEQKYYTDEDFEKYFLDADAYCVGSDQVWNSGWNLGFLPAMFLNFVPDEKYKFSFSSSFGVTMLSEEEKRFAKPLLERFNHISVRESTAIDVLKSMGINQGVNILDPTLLLPSTFWDKLSSPRLVKEDYVLVYQLNPNKDFDNYAIRFAKQKKIKLVFIGMRLFDITKKGKVYLMPEVEEFLSLIKYASYVITDSFHGTAFSINFNRELIDIYPSEFSTRLDSILKWAEIPNRHLISFEDFEIADTPIDYEKINRKLEMERKKGMMYLENISSEIRKK